MLYHEILEMVFMDYEHCLKIQCKCGDNIHLRTDLIRYVPATGPGIMEGSGIQRMKKTLPSKKLPIS